MGQPVQHLHSYCPWIGSRLVIHKYKSEEPCPTLLHNELFDQGRSLYVPNGNDGSSHEKSPRTSSKIF
jgi:hypothetical protein